MHAWTGVFGTGEVATRFPSAVGLSLTCVAAAALGRVLGGPRLGLATGLVCVALPGLAWTGSEARQYAWSAAAAVLMSLALIRAGRSDRASDWAWYALAVAAGAYVFLFTLLLLPAHLTTLTWSRWPLRRWLVAAGLGSLAAVPVMVAAAHQTGQIAWIDLSTRQMLHAAVLGQYFLSPRAPAAGASRVCALVLLGAAGVLVLLALRAAGADPRLRLVVAVGLPWAMLPTLLVVAYSTLTRPVYQERYVTFGAPGLALLLGLGLLALRNRWRAHVLTGLVLAAVAAPVLVQQKSETSRFGEDYRDLASYIGPGGAALEGIVITRAGARGILIAYPSRAGAVPVLNGGPGPARSGTLWGLIRPPASTRLDQATRRVGLVSLTRQPHQAHKWRRWLRRQGCHPEGATEDSRFTVSAYRCVRGGWSRGRGGPGVGD